MTPRALTPAELEQLVRETDERYRRQAARDGLALGRAWPPEGKEREDFDRSTAEAIGP